MEQALKSHNDSIESLSTSLASAEEAAIELSKVWFPMIIIQYFFFFLVFKLVIL